MDEMRTLTDNTALNRYEFALDETGAAGGIAIAAYTERPGVRVITHTEVPAHLRGRGIGARMVKAVLDDIRARGLRVVPRCPFVRDFIRRFPAYGDLLEPSM